MVSTNNMQLQHNPFSGFNHTSCISYLSSLVAFSPQSKAELQLFAVEECLQISADGECSQGQDGPIQDWDVSRITDMSKTFYDAKNFTADISKWNMFNVTDMSQMFEQAESFNADISDWDVSRVTNMEWVFKGATSFNADISKWQVASVTAMNGMFAQATAFTVDISNWDVSSVTTMYQMFSEATSFNADISKWDVSSVSYMSRMFQGATSFNIDISNWDVSSATSMIRMLYQASSFNQALCGMPWIESTADQTNMFDGSQGGSILGPQCMPTPEPTNPPSTTYPTYLTEGVSNKKPVASFGENSNVDLFATIVAGTVVVYSYAF